MGNILEIKVGNKVNATRRFDKRNATRGGYRISEFVLLLLSFLGGSVGSLLGMFIFRHKISKTSFKIKFGLIFLVQILIIFYYLKSNY